MHRIGFQLLLSSNKSTSSVDNVQISQPGLPEKQPVWNHCFLFLGRDCATAFTQGAALVLEYYPTTTGTSLVFSPIGCAL